MKIRDINPLLTRDISHVFCSIFNKIVKSSLLSLQRDRILGKFSAFLFPFLFPGREICDGNLFGLFSTVFIYIISIVFIVFIFSDDVKNTNRKLTNSCFCHTPSNIRFHTRKKSILTISRREKDISRFTSTYA